MCYEFTDITARNLYKDKVDIIFTSEYNRDASYFSNIIEMKIAVQDSFEESDIIMPMREIAAKIEKKQLLEKLDMLKKLSGDGEEVISKAEMLRVIKAKKKNF